MLFRSKHSNTQHTNLNLIIRNNKIEQVSSLKFLGVYIDEYLSWCPYMKYLLSKLRSCLGATRRIRSFLNQKSLLTLYHSLFNSYLQYCITNYCYSNKTLVNKLQQLCNKFIRTTFGLKRNYNINDIMSKSEILNINKMLFKEINVLMFKQNIDKNPNVFLAVFTKATSNYNTRNKSRYIPKLYFNYLCQQSISYRGPIFWNKIPNSLKKNNQSLGSFCKNLHKFACKYTK